MSYVAPNNFTTGTKIKSDEVEGNIDALQAYVNGGVSIADLNAADWVKMYHVMKGEYIPLINRYEMTTGVDTGNLGVNETAGYSAKIIGAPTGASSSSSGADINFYLEHDADVLITLTCNPRAYSGQNLAALGDNGKSETFTLDSDTAAVYGYSTTQDTRVAEASFGIKPNGATGLGCFGGERRKPFYAHYSTFLTKGEHHFSMIVGAGDRQIPIFYYQLTIHAYYRA